MDKNIDRKIHMEQEITYRKADALSEFSEIVKTYLLPLMDVRGKFKQVIATSTEVITNRELVMIKKENNSDYIYFYPFRGTDDLPVPFYCKIGIGSNSAVKKIAIEILKELIKVSEYDFRPPFPKKRHYGKNKVLNTSYKRRTLDLAFELGMCYSLAGARSPEHSRVLHELICRMIDWSGRTYEGKNVPFGIVVDFSIPTKENAVDYIHFLENDCSAVFTDGVFTGIRLDASGKIHSFITREMTPPAVPNNKTIFAPFQYADIAKFCVGPAVGVIAMTNGEILLIKDQAIQFAKRGRKWVFFDWNIVYSKIRPYFLTNLSSEEITPIKEFEIREKIKTLYCTLLDVSFSHCGGCLAIVTPENSENIKGTIKERIDLFASNSDLSVFSEASKEKAQVLTYLLSYPEDKLRSFFSIEQQLRREILSLDGATVLSTDGLFYCVGSIVSVGGGSTGGGRTAAAKKLATFGVGIKVSEDGYIEAWGIPINAPSDGENDHTAPTSRMVRLFALK